MELFTDQYFMKEAIKEAKIALQNGEIPIGVVIVSGKLIIARSHNQVEQLKDATAHAEMIALTSAMSNIGAKYLKGCTIYITIEPCVMCGGAMAWAQINRVVWGASDDQKGISSIKPSVLHPKTLITQGIMQEECRLLLDNFFNERRKTNLQ